MRAAIIREYGTVPVVDDFDDPQAKDDAVVVDVLAAGLNPVDISMASGTFHGPMATPPYIPGREGVARTDDGRRVYFENPVAPFGPMAERSLVKPEFMVDVPDAVDDDLATCFGVAGLAAWLALERRARVGEGDKVVVLGASGVVGLIAVQAAKLMGAECVVAAARDEEGLARAKELGADAVVDLDDEPDVVKAIEEATGGGPSVVLDPLWGEPVAAVTEAAAPGARIVSLGQSASPEATFSSAVVRGKELSILGHSNFAVPREERQAAYRRMVEHCVAGELTADVERVPLERTPEAWKRQQESPHHKLAIIP